MLFQHIRIKTPLLTLNFKTLNLIFSASSKRASCFYLPSIANLIKTFETMKVPHALAPPQFLASTPTLDY